MAAALSKSRKFLPLAYFLLIPFTLESLPLSQPLRICLIEPKQFPRKEDNTTSKIQFSNRVSAITPATVRFFEGSIGI
jgi:hypothetical protein